MTSTTTTIETADTTDRWWEGLCGPVDRGTRKRLRHLGRERAYADGSVLVAEGTRAERFSLILDGEVEVIVGGAVVNTLTSGDFFGEVAMLYSRPDGTDGAPVTLPRTATVRATMSTRVRELRAPELMTLMDAAPAAASRISRRAIGRLAVLRG